MSENQTELTTPKQEETLDNGPAFDEQERIPEPWENAPEGLIYYNKIYKDGHLGTHTQSAKLAYDAGFFENAISENDIELSDVDNRYYLKSKCPHKTEEDKFNEAKQNKLSELRNAVASAFKTAGVKSSLGFKIDANEDAVRNLNGLVDIGHNDVSFCDYDNVIHEHVTAEQVKTMRNEVLLNGQNLYAQKWTYRAAVNAAETLEQLNSITFKFDMLDFSE